MFNPEYLILIVVLLILAAIVYFLLRNITKIIINSVIGRLILMVVNYFHLMQYLGKTDIIVNWASVLLCAIGGLPGAILVILLHIAGLGF